MWAESRCHGIAGGDGWSGEKLADGGSRRSESEDDTLYFGGFVLAEFEELDAVTEILAIANYTEKSETDF